MSDKSNPIEQGQEPASALNETPTPTSEAKSGLWARLSMTQKLSAIVSGSVVTVVGGYAGYSKLTTKPAAANAEPKVVATKPDDTKTPPKAETPPEPPPARTASDELPALPKPPASTPRGSDLSLELPTIPAPPVVGDRPKPAPVQDDFKSPMIPDITAPKALPTTLQNKSNTDIPILPVKGLEETAPPPKKVEPGTSPKIDLDLPPTPPKGDIVIPPAPVITPPDGKKNDPTLLVPPMPKAADPLALPPTPPEPMKMGDPLALPPIPMPPMKMGDPLALPPTPPAPMKMGDPLTLPPTPPAPMKMGDPAILPPTPMPPKKDDTPTINVPTISFPKDPTMPPPKMIDIPAPPEPPKNMGTSDPFPVIPIPAKKDAPTVNPTNPTTPMPPKKESYEEDWHTPKPGDTFAMISREYYKTPDYAAALEAYNKDSNKGGERIIRVPPPFVLEEKFPTLLGKTEKPSPADPKAPAGLKFEPVEPPTAPGARPAPPPAVAPVASRNDEYRVTNPAGEMIRDIARKVYGSPDSWRRVWEQNEGIDPTQPIPQGTTLRVARMTK